MPLILCINCVFYAEKTVGSNPLTGKEGIVKRLCKRNPPVYINGEWTQAKIDADSFDMRGSGCGAGEPIPSLGECSVCHFDPSSLTCYKRCVEPSTLTRK